MLDVPQRLRASALGPWHNTRMQGMYGEAMRADNIIGAASEVPEQSTQ